jgi:hypothetical protein
VQLVGLDLIARIKPCISADCGTGTGAGSVGKRVQAQAQAQARCRCRPAIRGYSSGLVGAGADGTARLRMVKLRTSPVKSTNLST